MMRSSLGLTYHLAELVSSVSNTRVRFGRHSTIMMVLTPEYALC
jgi:hypothetical protein